MEKEELIDNYLRLAAEFENYKKRTAREKENLVITGSEKAITSILPIVDDLERYIETEKNTEGIKIIYNKFQKILGSLGLEKLCSKDIDFNTDYHEAISVMSSPGNEGKVIKCVQSGYKLGNKILRHSKVIVGK